MEIRAACNELKYSNFLLLCLKLIVERAALPSLEENYRCVLDRLIATPPNVVP